MLDMVVHILTVVELLDIAELVATVDHFEHTALVTVAIILLHRLQLVGLVIYSDAFAVEVDGSEYREVGPAIGSEVVTSLCLER